MEKNGTTTRYGGAENGKADGMNPYIDKGTDGIIDKAIGELVEWSRLHGYDPKGPEFIGPAAAYVFDSMEKPDDYDFAEVLQKAQDDGVFDGIRIRDFNKECPIDGPKCTIGISDSGKIGIFYEGGHTRIAAKDTEKSAATRYLSTGSRTTPCTEDVTSGTSDTNEIGLSFPRPASLRGRQGGERPAIDRYALFRWKRHISAINQVHIAYHEDIYIKRNLIIR